MSLDSREDICNLALSVLGNRDTVNNLDTPTTDKEKTFAIWYDITRQMLLRETIPSFATDRTTVAQLVATPDFGYSYAYEYPSYAVKVLGIGPVNEKENTFTVESNKIYSDEDYSDGCQIRFIRDETDVSKFSPDFKVLLAHVLASLTCLDITQDVQKLPTIDKKITVLKASVCAINSQENRPIRISTSKFRLAREYGSPTTEVKR